MIFKIIVVIFLFLEFLHNSWIEDNIKKVAEDHNIKLKDYKSK